VFIIEATLASPLLCGSRQHGPGLGLSGLPFAGLIET
jgi:hypothetical protein